MTAKLQATADAFDTCRLDAALETRVEDEEWRSWWTQLPDFIKPDYPLDLPPCRMPFARYVFTDVGAPRFCPEAACRRAGTCQGGDGPPCFRADRQNLWQVLFLWWMMIYGNATDEEYEQSMRAKGNRYAQAASASLARRAGSRRKRRPADAAKAFRLG
jgi:hypothetical protein